MDVVEKSMQHIRRDVERGASILSGALRRGKRVLICGNGGSAADSQHFAAELVGRYRKERAPLSAIALTVDTSALTAIGNDYGFETVFERQIKALGRSGDVLVAFSTSGSSKNILKAMSAARGKKMKVILLTGEKGRRASGADVRIAVPSAETARVQEVHELIFHAWCEYIDAA